MEIEEREIIDHEFLKANASDRARLFAERYEAAVSGSEWPASCGGGSRGARVVRG
ncbi:unnamed protein product [Hapterophycus canaliculatus]